MRLDGRTDSTFWRSFASGYVDAVRRWALPTFRALGLVALALMAYQRVWHLGYIWDDDYYVTHNAALRDLQGLWRIWFDVTATPQYYPLVHSSFWVEFHLWGLNPVGYHAVNLILHMLTAILLWRVLVQLRVPGAWLAAAIFTVHPVHVESVAWITERKNVLSAVFYLGAALAYLRFEQVRDSCGGSRAGCDNRSPRRAWILYAAAFALFLFALLSKTVTCSLPAALLLVRWWRMGRLRQRDFGPLLPFFVIGLGLGMGTAWIELHHVGAEGAAWSLNFLQRILIAGRALCFYGAKLLWPARLTFIYPRWNIHVFALWQWLFPLAVLAAIVMLWLLRSRLGRGPLVSILFFCGTLFPALGFVNVFPFRYSFVADHFQYLASVGLIALGATGLIRLPAVVPATLLVLLGVLTWKQTAIYQNVETLWLDTIQKNPDSSVAQTNYGMVLLTKGKGDEALPHLQKAVALEPNDIKTQNGLELALLQTGHGEQSVTELQKALALDPNNLSAHFNLARSLLQLRRADEAIAQLQEVLKIDPNDTEAEKNLAWILATWPEPRIRDGARAVQLAERANQLTDSRNPAIAMTLAAAYAESGRFSDAIKTAEHFLKIANESGSVALAQTARQQLALYRSGKPFRDNRQ